MSFDYQPHFCECSKCGRKILVEQVLFGVPHTMNIGASCAECLAKEGLHPDFIEERPEVAKKIQEWIQSSASKVNKNDE